jgi:hypothetical protein
MTINPARWRVLSPYLDEALEIAVEERAAWLARIAARDSSLAADLRTMLVRHRLVHESHFLESALLEPGTTPMRSHASKLPETLDPPSPQANAEPPANGSPGVATAASQDARRSSS